MSFEIDKEEVKALLNHHVRCISYYKDIGQFSKFKFVQPLKYHKERVRLLKEYESNQILK